MRKRERIFPRLPRTLARRNNSPRKIPLSERYPEMSDDKYSSTRGACYIGYITQAISVNLAPLFYLIFQEKFSVTRTQIGQLVFIMFVVQLTVDVLSVYFIKKIGYRRACVISIFLRQPDLLCSRSFRPYFQTPT